MDLASAVAAVMSGKSDPFTLFNQYLDSVPVEQVRWILVAFVLTMWMIKSSVAYLNVKNLDAPLDPLIPQLYGPTVLKKYEKHKDYIRANNTFSEISGAYEEAITFAIWFGGVYALLDVSIRQEYLPGYSAAMHGTVFLLALTLFSSIVGLPFSYYKTFVLEERFGFNRSTVKTWLKDLVKGWILLILIGGVAFYLMFWLITTWAIEKYWYLLVAFFVAFQLIMMVLQPWIMRLFMEMITIEEGIAFVARGKSANKWTKNRYFYPVVSDGVLDPARWETRDAQFKGQSNGACVVLSKNDAGRWTLSEKEGNQQTYAISVAADVAEPHLVTKWDEQAPEPEAASDGAEPSTAEGSAESSAEVSSSAAVSSSEMKSASEEKEEDLEPDDAKPLWLKKVDMQDLKGRLHSMADEHKFKFSAVYIIDGSTRSEHSNAFFMGFLWFRKICLFDTLLKNMSVDSICGVMGHEMGHCIMMHIPKQLVWGILQIATFVFLISKVLYHPKLHAAFFVDVSDPQNITPWIGIQVTQLILTPVAFWFGIASNWLTRRYEYQADQFAVEGFSKNFAQDLVNGLKGLYKENKAHLNPHPLFVWLNHSHPTLVQRVKWIRSLNTRKEGRDTIRMDAKP